MFSKKSKYNQVVELKKYHRNYEVIRLALFINKIMNYEPELVIMIAFIHDLNYQSVVPIPKNLDVRRPVRRNACLGLFKPDFYDKDDFYCACISCDPYGEYMMKPYRIENKLFDKLKNKKTVI